MIQPGELRLNAISILRYIAEGGGNSTNGDSGVDVQALPIMIERGWKTGLGSRTAYVSFSLVRSGSC